MTAQQFMELQEEACKAASIPKHHRWVYNFVLPSREYVEQQSKNKDTKQ